MFHYHDASDRLPAFQEGRGVTQVLISEADSIGKRRSPSEDGVASFLLQCLFCLFFFCREAWFRSFNTEVKIQEH